MSVFGTSLSALACACTASLYHPHSGHGHGPQGAFHMGLLNEVRRNFITRPDFARTALVYKHDDHNIRKGTELTVAADETALFFRDGRIQGTLGPGRHTL